MVTKAVIEEIVSENKVRVRIPIFNKIANAPNSTPFEELSEATICTLPGCKDNCKVGDVVYIAFEDNDAGRPVVVGYLQREYDTGTLPDIKAGVLTVEGEAILPDRTTIGNVTPEDIQKLLLLNTEMNKLVNPIFLQLLDTLNSVGMWLYPITISLALGNWYQIYANSNVTAQIGSLWNALRSIEFGINYSSSVPTNGMTPSILYEDSGTIALEDSVTQSLLELYFFKDNRVSSTQSVVLSSAKEVPDNLLPEDLNIIDTIHITCDSSTSWQWEEGEEEPEEDFSLDSHVVLTYNVSSVSLLVGIDGKDFTFTNMWRVSFCDDTFGNLLIDNLEITYDKEEKKLYVAFDVKSTAVYSLTDSWEETIEEEIHPEPEYDEESGEWIYPESYTETHTVTWYKTTKRLNSTANIQIFDFIEIG